MACIDPDLRRLAEIVAADPQVTRPVKMANCLQGFIAANEDASRSPNFATNAADDVEGVVTMLGSAKAMGESEVAVRVLKALKILSRKYDNRVSLGQLVVPDLVHVLEASTSASILGEAANVVLNICYERENVQRIIDAGGVAPLVVLLGDDSQELQANAAGAIQSICFQSEGRAFVRELGAIPAVLPLLTSTSLKASHVTAM